MKEVIAFYPILIDGTFTTIILTILSALSEREYDDKTLKCIKGRFISLKLNLNFEI